MGEPVMLEPEGLAPPIGQYSHVSRVAAAELLFVAGQVAISWEGNLVGRGDFEAQMRQVFTNLERALAAGGAGLHNVTKFTTYVVGAEHVDDFYRVRRELFGSLYPDGRYPPNTLVVVDRLVSPDLLLEIEAVAGV
ncbi:MAG: RidA family protein [Actinomycetota bacterium]